MEEEIWKTIPNCTKYEASSLGRIRNAANQRVRKLRACDEGYVRIPSLHDENGNSITSLVHRIIAITFIDNPGNKPTVNHIDHNKSNNIVSNLGWATYQEQIEHSRKHQLTTDDKGFHDLWGKRKVWKCDKKSGDRLEMFETVREAGISIPWSKRCLAIINTAAEAHEISVLVHNSRPCNTTAMGYKWEFDELRTFSAEEWCDLNPADIGGATGYQISSLGRLSGHKGKVRSPYGPGYSKHYISKKTVCAHRLVAMSFKERIAGKDYVNHIDGNKSNPHAENLEWVDRSENAKHAYTTGLTVPKTKPVWQFNLEGRFIAEFDSIARAKRKFGSIDIRRSVRTSSSAGGFIWKHPTNDKNRVVRRRKTRYMCKKIRQYSRASVFIREFTSLAEAQREVPGLQNNAARTGGLSAGFRWKYASDTTPFSKNLKTHDKKINQYSLDMVFIRQYESIKAARIAVPGVCAYWANKHSKPSKGFRWAYV